jgi:hypothetical protein
MSLKPSMSNRKTAKLDPSMGSSISRLKWACNADRLARPANSHHAAGRQSTPASTRDSVPFSVGVFQSLHEFSLVVVPFHTHHGRVGTQRSAVNRRTTYTKGRASKDSRNITALMDMRCFHVQDQRNIFFPISLSGCISEWLAEKAISLSKPKEMSIFDRT